MDQQGPSEVTSRSRKVIRSTLVVAFAGLLVVALAATPANATITSSGHRFCSANNETAFLQSNTAGVLYHTPPGSTERYVTDSGTKFVTRRSYSPFGNGGGYWRVRVTGPYQSLVGHPYTGCKPGVP